MASYAMDENQGWLVCYVLVMKLHSRQLAQSQSCGSI